MAPDEDDVGALIGFVGTLLLGYAFFKAISQVKCGRCGGWTSNADGHCVHCGAFVRRD